VPRAAVSAGRIADVLDTKPLIISKENPTPLPDLARKKRGQVVFDQVSFSFEGAEAPALESVSIVAEPGETTAIIGSTGSGKSTVLNLIPRFYDVSKGSVLFDGIDVRDLDIQELRSRIGYVPQKSLLMSGTVAQNISYGQPDMLPEEVEKVAEVAQALDFIDKLEGAAKNSDPENSSPPVSGFDFEVAQGGSNVSGGQRQRLAIARALAIDPEVFLFDDSFSALDLKTDALLRSALKSKTADSTKIIVAQRVSSIMDADQIIVLDNGKIAGLGTHEELIKSCHVYKEIADSQLSWMHGRAASDQAGEASA
jgi:ATP-binding cassette subfamily B protein